MKILTLSILILLVFIRLWTSPYAVKKRVLYKKLSQNVPQQKAYPNTVNVTTQATKTDDTFTVVAQISSESEKTVEAQWHLSSLEPIDGEDRQQINSSTEPVTIVRKFRFLKSSHPTLFLEVFETTPNGKMGIMHNIELSDTMESAIKSITKKLSAPEGKILQ